RALSSWHHFSRARNVLRDLGTARVTDFTAPIDCRIERAADGEVRRSRAADYYTGIRTFEIMRVVVTRATDLDIVFAGCSVDSDLACPVDLRRQFRGIDVFYRARAPHVDGYRGAVGCTSLGMNTA